MSSTAISFAKSLEYAFSSYSPITFFVIDITVEIESIGYLAMKEVNYKFHLQALKKIMRTKRVNIYELALVMDVRT